MTTKTSEGLRHPRGRTCLQPTPQAAKSDPDGRPSNLTHSDADPTAQLPDGGRQAMSRPFVVDDDRAVRESSPDPCSTAATIAQPTASRLSPIYPNSPRRHYDVMMPRLDGL